MELQCAERLSITELPVVSTYLQIDYGCYHTVISQFMNPMLVLPSFVSSLCQQYWTTPVTVPQQPTDSVTTLLLEAPAHASGLSKNMLLAERLRYSNHPLHLGGIWMGSANTSNARDDFLN